MNKITQNFYNLMKEGYTTAKGITDVKDRTMALAALAQAIASTGLVESIDAGIESTDSVEKETPKKETSKKGASNTKKDALKPEAGKGTPAPKEETEEIAPVEDPTQAEDTTPENNEVEIEEEWTEAMTELKASELERLQNYCDNWTEDYVYGDCVSAFFESDKITGAENIRPTNIDGFLTYLDQLAEQFATQE